MSELIPTWLPAIKDRPFPTPVAFHLPAYAQGIIEPSLPQNYNKSEDPLRIFKYALGTIRSVADENQLPITGDASNRLFVDFSTNVANRLFKLGFDNPQTPSAFRVGLYRTATQAYETAFDIIDPYAVNKANIGSALILATYKAVKNPDNDEQIRVDNWLTDKLPQKPVQGQEPEQTDAPILTEAVDTIRHMRDFVTLNQFHAEQDRPKFTVSDKVTNSVLGNLVSSLNHFRNQPDLNTWLTSDQTSEQRKEAFITDWNNFLDAPTYHPVKPQLGAKLIESYIDTVVDPTLASDPELLANQDGIATTILNARQSADHFFQYIRLYQYYVIEQKIKNFDIRDDNTKDLVTRLNQGESAYNTLVHTVNS